MDRSSLAFLYGGESNRTATEVMLSGAQIQAQITTLIENKQSLFDQIIYLWTKYTAETADEESGLEISDNLIQRPMEPGETQALLGLFSANALSHQTLLEELQRGHVLSDMLDIEEELARVEEEKKKAAEEAIAMMQATSEGPESQAPKADPNANDEEEEEVNGAAARNKRLADTQSKE